MALRTITPKHRNFRRISIHAFFISFFAGVASVASAGVIGLTGEDHFLGQWSELDQVLAQLWESHSIRAEVLYYRLPTEVEQGVNERLERLLPQITGRGIVDLIGRSW